MSAILESPVSASGLIESLAMSAQVVPDVDVDVVEGLSLLDWARLQRQDAAIDTAIRVCEGSGVDLAGLSYEARSLIRCRDSLVVRDNVLFRRRQVDDDTTFQLVVPYSSRRQVLQSCHDGMGHLGRDRTLAILRDRVFWPGMARDVASYIAECRRCLCRKAVDPRAPLVSIESSQPLELVCMDFLKLEPSKGGVENVLVITDHFSRYAQAYPCRNQTAKTTAKLLYENYIVHYGFPARLHSDQGRNFTSSTIKHLCQLAGVEKSRTTPYHPMGNGQCERFNSTLLGMLGTLDRSQKVDWKAHVPTLVHAYNCSRHESTGYSPYFIMFGRHPRLPVDLLLGREIASQKQGHSQYVESLKQRLESAFQLASEKVAEAQKVNKGRYDLKARGAVLDVGDRVLVKNVGLRGTHKIADRWLDEVFVVVKQPNSDIPVFVVQPEAGKGRVRTLHRNLLLPISCIPSRDLLGSVGKDEVKGLDEGTVGREKARESSEKEVDSSSDSGESEEDVVFHPIPKPRAPKPLPRGSITRVVPVEVEDVEEIVSVHSVGSEVGSVELAGSQGGVEEVSEDESTSGSEVAEEPSPPLMRRK